VVAQSAFSYTCETPLAKVKIQVQPPYSYLDTPAAFITLYSFSTHSNASIDTPNPTKIPQDTFRTKRLNSAPSASDENGYYRRIDTAATLPGRFPLSRLGVFAALRKFYHSFSLQITVWLEKKTKFEFPLDLIFSYFTLKH